MESTGVGEEHDVRESNSECQVRARRSVMVDGSRHDPVGVAGENVLLFRIDRVHVLYASREVAVDPPPYAVPREPIPIPPRPPLIRPQVRWPVPMLSGARRSG